MYYPSYLKKILHLTQDYSLSFSITSPPKKTRGNYKHRFDGFALLYVIKISHIITWS